ncbi:MAG: mercury transporter MerT [Acidobacteria bacterium]|nr:mercury transporter MerT [Acidobacteriota bacterium]
MGQIYQTERTAGRDGHAQATAVNSATGPRASRTDRAIVAGGIAGAILASSCCIVPLALVTLGIGGAWVSRLTALAPDKPYFLAGTAALLGIGFWRVYGRPAPACVPGTLCAVPSSRRFTKAALWLGAAVAVLAASVDYWAPLFW